MRTGVVERSARVALAAAAALCLAATLLAAAGAPTAAALAAAPSGPSARAPEGGRITIFASILPYAWFLDRIGGDRVAAAVLVGPGQTPETFEPSPRELARLGDAAALMRAGVPFERALLPRLARAFPNLEMVDMLAGLPLRPWNEHKDEGGPGAGETGRGGDGSAGAGTEAHAHGDFDPHVWLDPDLARGVARNLAAALARLDPEHAGEYEARRQALDGELAALDRELAARLAPWRGRTFYVFHPAFGYFAARYGLRQAAIQTGGREPSPRQLAAVIDAARRDGARALYVQPQYAPRSAGKVAEALGAELVQLDDLARDYPDNLRRLADALARGFGATGTSPAPEGPR